MSSIKSKVESKISGTAALLNQAYSNLGGIGATLAFSKDEFSEVDAHVHAAAESIAKAKERLAAASELLRQKPATRATARLASTK